MYDPRKIIGKSLKSEEAIDILSDNNLQIIYDIDLLHENIDDIYWIEDKINGCLWRANKEQLIVVAFIYLRESEDYSMFKWKMDGIEIIDHKLVGFGNPSKTGSYDGVNWIRYDRGDLSTHYSWDAIGPKKLCFMHPSAIP